MPKVFVSYSHSDSNFADRLVLDLLASDVPASYDKWLLRVGDSIVQKIAAEVSVADSVIALLSPASTQSNWVKKELALAMTGEVQTAGVKVLPAVIADCELPPMLADKLYADFRHSYYRGLRALLAALQPEVYKHEKFIRKEAIEIAHRELGELIENVLADKLYADFRHSYYRGLRALLAALQPEVYKHEKFIRKEAIEIAHRELGELIENGSRDKLVAWFASNGFALAALFGRLWAVSEAVPRFQAGDELADFLVINGQSGRYELSLVVLGYTAWGIDGTDIANRESRRLEKMVQWCRSNADAVRHTLAVRMASSNGAEQIAPYDRSSWTPSPRRHHLQIDSKLLLARRDDYGEEENKLRNGIYDATNHDVDIISYDRVFDAVGKILNSHW